MPGMIHRDWDGWVTDRQEFLDRFGDDEASNRPHPWLWGEQSLLLDEAIRILDKMAEQIGVHSDPEEPEVENAIVFLQVAARLAEKVYRDLIEP